MRYKHLHSIYKKVYNIPPSFSIFGTSSIMKKVFLLTLCLTTVFLSNAQSDTVQIVMTDSLTSGVAIDSARILSNVNVFKDPRLEALKTRPKLVTRNKARERILEKRKETLNKKLGVNNVKNYSSIKRGKKKVTGSIVTRKGYRVVIYNGSNRAQALTMKRKFMRSYGGVRSYLSYRSPSYKIRVGNFASKTSAYRFLRKIQGNGFSKSFVAPDIVTIKDINVR